MNRKAVWVRPIDCRSMGGSSPQVLRENQFDGSGATKNRLGREMVTGELRNQVDRIWDAFWSGGISNPLEVIEQITYLLFLRALDDLQLLEEQKSQIGRA